MRDTGSFELGWRLAEAGIDTHRPFEEDFLDATASDAAYANASLTIDVQQLQKLPKYAYQLPNADTPSPQSTLVPGSASGEVAYADLERKQILVAGMGAAAIVGGAYWVHRGVSPENVHFVSPTGEFGGIWAEDWARAGGFNNPAGLRFLGGHVLTLADRGGDNMAAFLDGITDRYLRDSPRHADAVVDLYRGRRQEPWLARTANGNILEADYVVLATGTPHPRNIDGGRFRSNLDAFAERGNSDANPIIVERRQRKLEQSELENGRPFVLVGIGNSTATMLRQIQTYEDQTGESVEYWVATDAAAESVNNPAVSRVGRKQVFRDPSKGYLTGYSDLPHDVQAYCRALEQGRIISDVRKLQFNRKTGELTIAGSQPKLRVEAPHVFALLGYERDETLFRRVGAMVRTYGVNGPNIRPSDGAVWTPKQGFTSNLFAMGAVAVDRRSPNAGVIPGIFAQVPRTTLTMGVRAHADRLKATDGGFLKPFRRSHS